MASTVYERRGLPQSDIMFLLGIPFEPERAGTKANKFIMTTDIELHHCSHNVTYEG